VIAITGCGEEPPDADTLAPSPSPAEPAPADLSSKRSPGALPVPPAGEGPERSPDRYYYSDEQGDYSLPADGDYDGDGRDDCQEQAEQSGPDSVDWEYCD